MLTTTANGRRVLLGETTMKESRGLLRKFEPGLNRNHLFHPRELEELAPLQILQPNRSTIRDPASQNSLQIPRLRGQPRLNKFRRVL